LTFCSSPIYCNYEIMVNAFNTKIIDLSQADIYKISNLSQADEMSDFLGKQYKYSGH